MDKIQAYLGIDPSTASTGFGVIGLDDELLAWGAIAPDKKILNEAECITLQYNVLAEVLDTYDILGIGCEDQFAGPNQKTYKQLCRISGCFILLGGMHGVPVEILTPGAWRKLTHGKGDVNKKYTQKWVNETYAQKFLVKHNDITDGIGIAYATKKHFQGENTHAENETQTG